jgi:hypothetical protein
MQAEAIRHHDAVQGLRIPLPRARLPCLRARLVQGVTAAHARIQALGKGESETEKEGICCLTH